MISNPDVQASEAVINGRSDGARRYFRESKSTMQMRIDDRPLVSGVSGGIVYLRGG